MVVAVRTDAAAPRCDIVLAAELRQLPLTMSSRDLNAPRHGAMVATSTTFAHDRRLAPVAAFCARPVLGGSCRCDPLRRGRLGFDRSRLYLWPLGRRAMGGGTPVGVTATASRRRRGASAIAGRQCRASVFSTLAARRASWVDANSQANRSPRGGLGPATHFNRRHSHTGAR